MLERHSQIAHPETFHKTQISNKQLFIKHEGKTAMRAKQKTLIARLGVVRTTPYGQASRSARKAAIAMRPTG